MRLSSLALGLCAAGFAFAGITSAASAQEVAGTWSFANGDAFYHVNPDPSAFWNTANGSGELWSRQDATAQSGQTASSAIFTPNTPVRYGDISNLSIDFDVKSGRIEGGSPRWVIYLDQNGNGQLDMDAGQNLTPVNGQTDAVAVLTWNTWPSIPGGVDASTDTTPGFINSGNFLDTAITDASFERVSNLNGGNLGYSTPAQVLAAVQNLNVVRIDLASDSGWSGRVEGAAFQNMSLTTVPEPTSIGLLAVGGAFLFRRRRSA